MQNKAIFVVKLLGCKRAQQMLLATVIYF